MIRSLKKRVRKLYLHFDHEKKARQIFENGILVNEQELTFGPGRIFLAIVTTIKGEAPFLVEWLEFHLLMGVQHIVVYDNGMEPETEAILDPYVAEGLVTRIPWPDHSVFKSTWKDDGSRLRIQELAFGNCVQRYNEQIEWLIKIDLDEFLYPPTDKYGNVYDVMKMIDQRNIMGIRVPLRQFGSSGHVESPQGLVIENYVGCEKGLTRSTKSIGHMPDIIEDYCGHCHHFRYRHLGVVAKWLGGSRAVMHRNVTAKYLVINHYRLKSREDYLRKGTNNQGGWMSGKQTLERFEEIDATHNEEENRDIQRFIPQLKSRIAQRESSYSVGREIRPDQIEEIKQ